MTRSKYNALEKYLKSVEEDEIILTIDQIENIVGKLPPSARYDRTWWGNAHHPSRTHANAWLKAGWVVIDGGTFTKGFIKFVKSNTTTNSNISQVFYESFENNYDETKYSDQDCYLVYLSKIPTRWGDSYIIHKVFYEEREAINYIEKVKRSENGWIFAGMGYVKHKISKEIQ